MSTYHHGDLRAAVLAAAGKLIEREGLARLSVREAARRAGVSHNAPYRHFPDRDALLAALAAEGFNLLEKSLHDLSGRELGEAYVGFALAHPQRFRLMFSGQEPRAAEAVLERFTTAFAGLGADARFPAAAAWSLVHGLAHLLVEGRFEGGGDFVRKVLGAIRFAVGREAGAQRSA
jgi:AcrR family transcriptional regulator